MSQEPVRPIVEIAINSLLLFSLISILATGVVYFVIQNGVVLTFVLVLTSSSTFVKLPTTAYL